MKPTLTKLVEQIRAERGCSERTAYRFLTRKVQSVVPPHKHRIPFGIRTDPAIRNHFQRLADHEGIPLSGYLHQRLRELRACDLLLKGVHPTKRNIVRIIQEYTLQHKEKP